MEIINKLKRKPDQDLIEEIRNSPTRGGGVSLSCSVGHSPIITPKKRIKWNISHSSKSSTKNNLYSSTTATDSNGVYSPVNTPTTPEGSGSAATAPPPPLRLNPSPARPLVVVQQQLCDLLQGLEKSEIIRIITRLTQDDQNLEDRITQLLPRPTLEITVGILSGLEKKLIEAIPYSRLGPDRSDYSFNRVKAQIDELRGSLLQYLDFFTLPSSYPSSLQHEYPGESFSYLHQTTSLIHRLPIWSNQERNRELKDPLYEKLAQHWRITIAEVARRVNHEGTFCLRTLI